MVNGGCCGLASQGIYCLMLITCAKDYRGGMGFWGSDCSPMMKVACMKPRIDSSRHLNRWLHLRPMNTVVFHKDHEYGHIAVEDLQAAI